MKTLILKVEDTIYDKVLSFLKLFPGDRLNVITDIQGVIPFVDEQEQKEIEKLLKNNDCFVMEETETTEL